MTVRSADYLAQETGYWNMVPGLDRHLYRITEIAAGNPSAHTVTITKDDADWEKVFAFPELVELTLHEPNADQLQAVRKLGKLQRLRISHARPRNIEFLAGMVQLRELVLEYVSGFSDLAPLGTLQNLRSLSLENLRAVTDFSPLCKLTKLVYLRIEGTYDRYQPVDNFEFLYGMGSLEVLKLGMLRNQVAYPALLSITGLKKLQVLEVFSASFDTREYALLEEAMPDAKGLRPACLLVSDRTMPMPEGDPRHELSDEVIAERHPDVILINGRRLIRDPRFGYYLLHGKGRRPINCDSPNADKRRAQFLQEYAQMKQQARTLLDSAAPSIKESH